MDANAKPSFFQTIRGLEPNFWFANVMEILERLAFFGARAVVPLYLVASPETENGLGVSFAQKGVILGVWALVQCLVPMVSGGYTERYGYRKSLAVAFVINATGYLLMAWSKPIADSLISSGMAAEGWGSAGFWVFMLAACCVGLGTAIFKPPCHGTIAKTTTEATSSMGWGIFYWVVNIGGALAPMLAAPLRGQFDWQNVFYAAALVTLVNFLPAFLLYREPEKSPPKEGEAEEGPIGVFFSSLATMFKDARLMIFLLIFSCFWLMFMQLWDLLPNFVDEWVDTANLAPIYKAVGGEGWVLDSGQVKPEMIININPWSIILLVIPISWLVGKVSKVAAMVIGMLIALVGFVGAGMTMTGWVVALMLLIFTIGEMTCSPTFSAYVGLIAPPEKKALYMGYSNMPFAIGWFFGNIFGGFWYEAFSSKYELARRYLVDQTGITRAAADELNNQEAIEAVANAVAGDPTAIAQATQTLWNTYDPWIVWIYLGIFGFVGTVGMILFYFATRKAVAAAQQEAVPTDE